MLDYAKIILPEVSFRKQLFQKELKKCLEWVDPTEVQQLHDWCYEKFEDTHPDVLKDVFASALA